MKQMPADSELPIRRHLEGVHLDLLQKQILHLFSFSVFPEVKPLPVWVGFKYVS